MELGLREKTKAYANAIVISSCIEIFLTLSGYTIFITGLYYTYTNQLWWSYTLFVLVGSLFMVKIFVLFHDCTHHSMFNQPFLNRWVGRFLSLFITTPFTAWKIEHDDHHSHVVDMEKIKYGDIPLWTVEQYKNASPMMQWFYRIFRHPVFMLLFTPILYFFVKSRVPTQLNNSQHVLSVMTTNVFVLLVYGTLIYLLGFWTVVFVFVPAAYLGGLIGIALFYLQHDYPGAEWFDTEHWDHETASLHGSSLIILPQPFEWFTHAIGYHHIHHLNSKVPGYKLKKCYEDVAAFQEVIPLTMRDIINAFELKLWSYEKNALIPFDEFRNVQT